MTSSSGKSSSWMSMLERTNSLLAQIPQRDDTIPTLERDPVQLETAVNSLLKGQQTKGNASDNRAVRLLGQYSFDVDKLERDLHQIAPKAAYDPTELFDHHDRIISSTVEEAMIATRTESEHQFQLLVEDDWEAAKLELLEDLEHEAKGVWKPMTEANGSKLKIPKLNDNAKFQATMTPYSTVAITGADTNMRSLHQDGGAVHQMTTEMFAYSKVVEKNITPTQTSTNWMDEFKRAISVVSDPAVANIVQTWDLASFLVANKGHEVGHALGARKYLEAQYKLFIDRHTQHATGPAFSPDLASTIRAWLGVMKTRPLAGMNAVVEHLGMDFSEPLDVVDSNLPLWAVVYYCMRCGGWREAATVLRQALDQNKLLTTDHAVLRVLEAFPDGPAGRSARDPNVADAITNVKSLHNAMAQEQRSSAWKRAVVQLLACDVRSKPSPVVNASIQDFMWFKLCAVLSSESGYSMRDLSETIMKIGPDHFNGNAEPYLFTRLLLMCQRYEQAIGFLASKGFKAMTTAVHLAIAFNTYGDLRTLANENAVRQFGGAHELVSQANGGGGSSLLVQVPGSAIVGADLGRQVDGGDVELFDLGYLLQQYVKRFARNDPRRAVIYLLQLRDANQKPTSEALAYLKALLMETKDFEMLLDGPGSRVLEDMRRPRDGLLYQLLPSQEVVTGVVQSAARDAEAEGFPDVAFELYIRGTDDDLNNALSVLNTQLAEVLEPAPTEGGPYSEASRSREKWVQLARMFQDSFFSSRANVGQYIEASKALTFRELGSLVAFFNVLNGNGGNKYEVALQHTESLLPVDQTQINACADKYRELEQPILNVFSHVVLKTVDCLYKYYNERKKLGDQAKMQMLSQRAYTLVTFAGLIKLGDVSKELAMKQVEMSY